MSFLVGVAASISLNNSEYRPSLALLQIAGSTRIIPEMGSIDGGLKDDVERVLELT